MINSKSGYVYLNGDAIPSDVTVNGGIMPLRTGDAQNNIRGEDICLLKEAIEERRRAVGKTEATPTFANGITSAQVGDIVSQSQDMFYEYSNLDFHALPWEWISGFPSTSVNEKIYSLPGYDASTGGTKDYFNMSAYSGFGVSRINKPSPIVICDGLMASDLSSLFSTVGGLKYYCQGYWPTYPNQTFGISKTDLGGTYAYYSELTSDQVDFFCRSPGITLYHRSCMAWGVSDAGYYGWEGIVSSLSTPAFTNKCAVRGKIYGVFEGYSSKLIGGHSGEAIDSFYLLKHINDGPDESANPNVNKYSWNYSMSLNLSSVVSIVNSIKSELTLLSPAETAELIDYSQDDGNKTADYSASVNLRFVFPVFELRNRTRWDA